MVSHWGLPSEEGNQWGEVSWPLEGFQKLLVDIM